MATSLLEDGSSPYEKIMNIEKKKIIEELAPWVSPSELSQTYGITHSSIYHYCDRYNIPKYRENMATQRADFENEWKGYLEDVIAEKKRRLQDYLNGNNQ